MIQKENISKETKELFAKVTLALKQARIEAHKVAMRTNTPLVIYDPEYGIQEVTVTEIPKDVLSMHNSRI